MIDRQDRVNAPSKRSLRALHTPRLSPATRSKRTNDPLALPPSMDGPRAQSSDSRRWLDLVAAYGAQLGPERMTQEQTRALLSNLIGLTLISERITGDLNTDPSHLIQLGQAISKLLGELGLRPDQRDSRDATPAPRDFARAFDKQKAAT